MMRHRLPFVLATALAFTGEAAGAQTVSTTTVKLPTYTTPIASTSFTAYLAFGTLSGLPINLAFVAVDMNSNSHLDGTVTLKPGQKSGGYLTSPIGIPNGDYSVQLVFAHVNQPAVVTIGRGASTVLVSCALVMSSNPQTCNSGVFSVTDGQLGVYIGAPSGSEIYLGNVTVNRWK